MYFEERKRKNGKSTYYAVDRYVDPLTGKAKREVVKFTTNTARARKQAERDLAAKIEELIAEKQGAFNGAAMVTFGDLKAKWLETWQTTVKPPTVTREKMVLKRIENLMADDVLLEVITPLLIQNLLNDYKKEYHSTHSTMQHIKCSLNKIFDYGVLHNAIPFSPTRVIKLSASSKEKREKRLRREAKFLDEHEVHALLAELRKRRHKTYYDLALFMIGTGCRIGEAAALTEADIDFENRLVTIDKSLQYHDLRVDEYYEDTTKTEAGERVEELPCFAIEALKRVIARNKAFDEHMADFPADAFHASKSLFRTEYGSPITSHSFREILTRINRSLTKHCQEWYGFEWTKNAIPHGFRHIHISVLRDDPSISLKEVQKRVGHVRAETTDGYTHTLDENQDKSVEAITRFIEKIG